MKTVIVTIPDGDEGLLLSLFKKFRFKSKVLSEEEREELAMAAWIKEGDKTAEVKKETVYSTLRKA